MHRRTRTLLAVSCATGLAMVAYDASGQEEDPAPAQDETSMPAEGDEAMPAEGDDATAAAPEPSAEPISRSNWVPNVGQLNVEGEQPLGDLWTFRCPKGGTVNVSVDTKDDTDTAQADIDPVLLVVDGAGNLLAFADDDVDCTYPPVCGFFCPSVTALACGSDGEHTIIVRDFGAADATGTPCQEGGGYNLVVEAFTADGSQVSERRVDLGGGPRRDVPKYALDLGKAPTGPGLDDEDVPHGMEFFDSGLNRSAASPGALLEKEGAPPQEEEGAPPQEE
jgi:hypothetical protein